VTEGERVNRSKRWSMWLGSQTDFKALLRIIDEKIQPLTGEFIDGATSWEQSQLRSVQSHIDRINSKNALTKLDESNAPIDLGLFEQELETALSRLEKAQAKAKLDSHIAADILLRSDERRTIVLDGEKLAAYFEDKRPLRVELSAPKSSLLDYRISLTFDFEDGVALSVASTDSVWVSATFSDLQEAIGRNVPRWSFIRSQLVSFVVLFIGSFVGWYLALDGIGDAINNETVSTWLLLAWIVFSIVTTIGGKLLFDSKVRAFEIVPMGQKPTARALFGLIGSTLLAIGVGIFVNVLTG
jgi:hypothetical protein